MARTNTIRVIRTTRANLNAQATAGALLIGEPYFITDEERFAVGTSTTTYQTYAKQSEAGSSGPITDNQLPLAYGYPGQYTNVELIQVDKYGRITGIFDGTRKPIAPGNWIAKPSTATYDFSDRVAPTQLKLSDTPSFIDYQMENGATATAMQLPTRLQSGFQFGSARLECFVAQATTLSLSYFFFGAANAALVALQVNGSTVGIDTNTDGKQRTFTVTLQPGVNKVAFAYQNMQPDTNSNCYITRATLPVDTYIFGDVVNYSGRKWSCVLQNTSQVPGAGSDWAPFDYDILPTNNSWSGTNTFAGSVALNGTTTAVTAAAGTSSTLVATTEFVASATGALTPRLVPLGGTSGQMLSRDGSGNLTWTTASGGGSQPSSHPGYIVGNWYSPQLDTVQRDGQPFANNLFARPILIGANTKVDGLGLSTGYSASIGFTSTTAYLALYSSANGLPTTRVAYGQVSMSATSTACTVSFSATTLTPGWYWLAYVAAARTIVVTNPATSFATTHLVGASSPPSGNGTNGIAATFTYAVPPTTFPSSTYQVADLPIVSWRASA